MISPLGESFGLNLANLGSPGDAFFDAEEYTEKIVAPAQGRSVPLSRGPIVESNLTLYRASDNFVYALGLDYFEVASGAIENVRIPEGTPLRAEYVYYSEPSIEEGGGIYAASAGLPQAAFTQPERYASLVKWGL